MDKVMHDADYMEVSVKRIKALILFSFSKSSIGNIPVATSYESYAIIIPHINPKKYRNILLQSRLGGFSLFSRPSMVLG